MAGNNTVSGNFREAVPIEVSRIFDSCSAKDCFEDLQCYFTPADQAIVDAAICVKTKSASVLSVFMDVEPITFNKGYYSVDVTFFFKVEVEVITSPITPAATLDGLCFFTKKVILYGGEANAATFTSDEEAVNLFDSNGNSLPQASIQVVEPIFLAAKLCEHRHGIYFEPCVGIPASVLAAFNGDLFTGTPDKMVLATLGLFSIVNLQRKTQLVVPVYDYSIPGKECTCNTEDPCEVFRSIKFPVDEFFPSANNDDISSDSCG